VTSDLAHRLELSLVLLTLRLQAPLHIERICEKTGLTHAQVTHDILWLRFNGVDVSIKDRVVSLH
jgi:biotin operon repressor